MNFLWTFCFQTLRKKFYRRKYRFNILSCHFAMHQKGLETMLLGFAFITFFEPFQIDVKKFRSSYLDVACKKSILKNFAKFTRKFTGVSVLMNFRLYASNFIKKRLWHRCFPVNFGKLLKFSFFIERQRTAASENWDLIFLLILKLGMTHWWKHSSKNS